MSTNTDDVTNELMTGRVKWFNNKSGYGFITVTDGSKTGMDIFVHHSAIVVSSEQYKYLVQGEYTEFKLTVTSGGVHEFQAIEVRGIKGGKLMCETRHDFKISREGQEENVSDSDPVRAPRSVRAPRDDSYPVRPRDTPRARGPGPREGSEWTVVKPREGAAGRGSTSGRGASLGRGRGRGRPPAQDKN